MKNDSVVPTGLKIFWQQDSATSSGNSIRFTISKGQPRLMICSWERAVWSLDQSMKKEEHLFEHLLMRTSSEVLHISKEAWKEMSNSN